MEMRLACFAVGLLLCGSALGQAYTWTDENGVVHFSDRPHPGAKEIDLPKPSSSRPRPVTRPSPAEADEPAESNVPVGYNVLQIVNPAAEETLWNIEGTLSVALDLSPALMPGHQVRVYFDGNASIVAGTTFQLREVWRGVHNLQVEVIDETGKMLIRSPTNRFYVQQTTVQ